MSRGDQSKMKRVGLTVGREKVLLVAGVQAGDFEAGEEPLAELRLLADTAGAEVSAEIVQKIRSPNSRTYIGKGKVSEIGRMARELGVKTAIFDNELTPAQMRNIEEATDLKIVDRAELILGIFAGRARTRQAKLQVSLAQLEYVLPRLRRMWTHLERQAGGIGLRGGPGERQIEVDRRQVRKRIKSLKDDLSSVISRRERTVSKRDDSYNVSLIGYTNAGKSTLLNALTGDDAFVEDRLFATLETRTRKMQLEGGYKILLSDTVGFIRRLPHDLIASFHATLEEARNADLLLHVVDASSPSVLREMNAVEDVLTELGIHQTDRLIAFNKIDLLEDPVEVNALTLRYPDSVPISARTGKGLDPLKTAVMDHAANATGRVMLRVYTGDGKALSFIAQHGFEISREYIEDHVEIEAMIKPGTLKHLLGEYPSVKQVSA